jgi:mannosyltransferase OCH1-like enzyme
VFRLAFLLREGGVWADMDDRCLSPLSAFVPADVEACFWQENLQSIGNNFMAVVPGHPIIRRAFITAVNSINRGDRDKVWMLTGPGLLSRAFAIEMAAAGQNWHAWLRQIAVLDEYDLARSVSLHCRTAHKRTGHHWSDKAFSLRGPRPYAASRAAA